MQVSQEELISKSLSIKGIEEAKKIIGGTGSGFSEPSKMPCYSYNLPASYCEMGTIYRGIKGSVCSSCYACPRQNDIVGKKPAGGWYDSERVQTAMMRRLNAVLFDPRWTNAMIYLLSHYKFPFFRWHDSGDIQNLNHMRNICKIADAVPETKFWLPTQQGKELYQYWMEKGQVALDQLHPNLTIRLSAVMIDGLPALSFARRIGVKVSRVSTKENDTDCPASKQGNSCCACRKCWDQNKESVTYHFHDGHGDMMHTPFILNIKQLIDGMLEEGTSKQVIDKIISKRFSLQQLNVRLIRANMLKEYKKKIKILTEDF